MYLENLKNIKATTVKAPGAFNVDKQVLIGPAQGWQGWVMRLFSLARDGHTPCHTHPWPHINYITSGEGILLMDGKEYEIEQGFVAYIPSGIVHQFRNRGQKEFSFICIVPEEGEV